MDGRGGCIGNCGRVGLNPTTLLFNGPCVSAELSIPSLHERRICAKNRSTSATASEDFSCRQEANDVSCHLY